MNKEIPTAEEILRKYDIVVNKTDTMSYTVKANCKEAMIEFAKLHLEAQAKAIYEKAKINVVPTDEEDWENVPEVITSEDLEYNEGVMLEIDQDSILNAYPLNNVK
jgi:hypothetical protein